MIFHIEGSSNTYEDKKVEEKKEVFDGIRHTALHVVPSNEALDNVRKYWIVRISKTKSAVM